MARKSHLPKRQTLVICVNGGLGLPQSPLVQEAVSQDVFSREISPLFRTFRGFISRSGMPGEAMERKWFGNQVVASVQGISFGGWWS